MNNIVLIGGSGFLGSRLSNRLLQSGQRFLIFDKNRSHFPDQTILGDLCVDLSSLKTDSSDILVNLAALHRDDVRPISLYDDVNIGGAQATVELAKSRNIKKIVFTSSVAIYGFAPPETSETGKANFFNDYGRTKFEAEEVFKQWHSEDPENRALIIVRPTVIFGEGNRGNVYNLLKQIASKRFVMFGSGKNRKSMAYVENVAAFLEYSLNFGPGIHIYNYVDKPDFDMNSLISLTRKTLFGKENVGTRLPGFLGLGIGYLADFFSLITRKSLPVSSIRVKKFMGTTQFASAAHESGFIAPISLEEGLAKTLKYEFLEDNSDKKTYETE